jgi:hypothetical protein
VGPPIQYAKTEDGVSGREERIMAGKKELTRFGIDFVESQGAVVAGGRDHGDAGGWPSVDEVDIALAHVEEGSRQMTSGRSG